MCLLQYDMLYTESFCEKSGSQKCVCSCFFVEYFLNIVHSKIADVLAEILTLLNCFVLLFDAIVVYPLWKMRSLRSTSRQQLSSRCPRKLTITTSSKNAPTLLYGICRVAEYKPAAAFQKLWSFLHHRQILDKEA